MSPTTLLWMLAGFVCIGNFSVAAQENALLQPSNRLQTLSRSAGAIFTGTVIAVHRVPARTENEVDTVQITFRVSHALRGAHAGTDLTIREWTGLWAAGERYRVGERVLLFLYPPSQLGLTSPVAGREGRFSMDEQDRVMVRGEMLQELSGVRAGTATGATPAARGFTGTTWINYRELFRATRRGSGE